MRLVLVILTLLFAVSVQSQTNTQVPLKQIPKKDPSKTDIKVTPTFPETESSSNEQASWAQENGKSLAQLPSFQQDKVFGDLHSAMDKVEAQIRTKNPHLDLAYDQAKDGLNKLQANKSGDVSKLLLWSLNRDAGLISLYQKTGDVSYATAALNNVRNVTEIAGAASAGNASVTVETVPTNGFEVCYTWGEWAELKNPPFLTFANPSEAKESLPKNVNYSFWSRDFQDHNKVGTKTPKFVDGDKKFSIGAPPQ